MNISRPTAASVADQRQITNLLSGFYDALTELRNSVAALAKTLAIGAFIVQTPMLDLPKAQALSTLGTGLLKNTNGTGVLTIAIDGTDYLSPATGAPIGAHFVTTQAEAGLSSEFSLGSLASGLLYHAVAAGVSTPAALNGTTGSVVYFSATGVPGQDNANFFWDGTNHRLGIGTAAPTYQLEVVGTAAGVSTMRLDNTSGGGFMYISKGATGIGGIGASGTWLGTGATDVAFGSYAGKKMQFFVNGSGTSSMEISTGGQVYVPGTFRLDGAVALGGGAVPTLGTIGGTGPAAAAQAKWIPINSGGTQYWVPAWT